MKPAEPNSAIENHLIQTAKEFAVKMNELETRIFEIDRIRDDDGVETFKEFRNEYIPIFQQFATSKRRVYGGQANSFGKPTRYDGIKNETEGRADLKSSAKAEVYFKTGNIFEAEYLFVFRKENGEWKIDNVKHKRYKQEKWDMLIM
ncbi:MAG: hypothetical protein IPO40_10585 [Fibrobacteres bacterium]|nr:hypothetical protein [Fibrobacterota bacterium]